MKRYGMVTRVLPGKLDEYKRLHADVWPGVLSMIEQSNICNYSIFTAQLPDGHNYLFSYFEYLGDDFHADMAKMAADEETQRWWDVCKPLLTPVVALPPGEVWMPVEEVFHTG
jgi:L-rhamnose mutarotase